MRRDKDFGIPIPSDKETEMNAKLKNMSGCPFYDPVTGQCNYWKGPIYCDERSESCAKYGRCEEDEP